MRVPDLKGDDLTKFWGDYSNWEGRVKASFFDAAVDKKSAAITRDNAINMADLLEALPGAQRRQYLDEYRNIIRFDDMMDEAKKAGGVRTIGRKGRVKRFNIDRAQASGGDNPLAFLLNRMSIQHDPLRPKRFGLGKQFEDYIGKNIPTAAYAQNAMGATQHAQNMLNGAKVMVFDTETTGTATNLAGVRQVASGQFTVNASGTLDVANQMDVRFATAGMQFGKVRDDATGKLVSLAEKFDKGLKPSKNIGDDFADKLIPFLEGIINADHVAGHNVEFDIRQTLANLQKTAAYKNPKASKGGLDITDLVDRAMTKISQPGVLVDTQDLVKNHLPDLELAKHLDQTDRLAPYSMENIVLKTNLAELMIEDMGHGPASAFFTGAQHTADYDTRLTAHLMQFVAQGRLEAKDIGTSGGTIGADSIALQQKIYSKTLQTHAIIPSAHITDINELHPQLFDALAEGKYGQDAFRIYNPSTGNNIGLRPSTIDSVRSSLLDENDSTRAMRSGVSYLEQEMWEARHPTAGYHPAVKGAVTGEEIVGGLGEWNRFAGIKTSYRGFLNRDQTISKLGLRPTQAEFEGVVKHMADLGNPFADLSVPERMITNALASAGSTSGSVKNLLNATDVGTRRAAQLGGDLGVLHWAQQDLIHDATKYGSSIMEGAQVNMPLDVFRYLEDQDVSLSHFSLMSDESQMLDISAFQSEDGDKLVNLRYGFEKGEAEKVAAHFETLTPSSMIGDKKLSEYGLETVQDVMTYAENIRTMGKEYGATVGFMDQTAGEIGHDVIEGTLGSTRDKGSVKMRAAFHSTEDGLLASGPAVGDRLMDQTERVAMRGKVHKAMGQFGEAAKHLTDDSVWKQARLSAMRGGATSGAFGDVVNNVIEGNWDELYPMLKTKKAGIAALGVGAALGGYYLLKRHKKREAGMEPFEEMPIEAQSHREPPMYPGTQPSTMSPMATAGTVGFMDSQRTNHSVMGTAKYSSLYGGAI